MPVTATRAMSASPVARALAGRGNRLAAEFWALAFTALVALYAGTSVSEEEARLFGAVGSVMFIAASAPFVWLDLRASPLQLWSPVWALRLVGLVFFGIGNLVAFTGDPVQGALTIDYLRALYPYTFVEGAKAQAVFYVGYIITLFTAQMVSGPPPRAAASRARPTGITALALGLLLAGSAIQALQLFVALTRNAELPGIVASLGRIFWIGIFLTSYQAVSAKRWGAFAAIAGLTLCVAALQALRFGKLDTLLPLAMLVGGVVAARPTVPRLLLAAAVMIGLFAVINRPYALARQIFIPLYTDATTVPLGVRLPILLEGFELARYEDAAGPTNTGFTRLSYINAGAFSVTAYDNKAPGDTYGYVLDKLVPRFLWPDKPIRRPGADFNLAVRGVDSNQITPTIYGEAYWNGGWWAIAWVSISAGIILGVWARIVASLLSRAAWIYAPFIFLGVWAAFKVQGMFVEGIFGQAIIGVALYVAISIGSGDILRFGENRRA